MQLIPVNEIGNTKIKKTDDVIVYKIALFQVWYDEKGKETKREEIKTKEELFLFEKKSTSKSLFHRGGCLHPTQLEFYSGM